MVAVHPRPHPEGHRVAMRLEGWGPVSLGPTLRDASLRDAPQGEVVVLRSFGGAAVPESRRRLFARVVAARDVALDQLGLALGRIAEAAATRRLYAHDVADTDLDVLVLGKVRRPVGLVALGHGHGVGAARLATQHTLRAGAAVIHHHGHPRLAAAQLDRIVDAEAAAPFAGAARAFAQRELLEQDGIELLQ